MQIVDGLEQHLATTQTKIAAAKKEAGRDLLDLEHIENQLFYLNKSKKEIELVDQLRTFKQLLNCEIFDDRVPVVFQQLLTSI